MDVPFADFAGSQSDERRLCVRSAGRGAGLPVPLARLEPGFLHARHGRERQVAGAMARCMGLPADRISRLCLTRRGRPGTGPPLLVRSIELAFLHD